ncbi:hypothetical protein Tco_0605997 [Tanacetum coccineum]
MISSNKKKMKGVAFDSHYVFTYEDVKARFKHQTLVQDYLHLEKETEAARNYVEFMKQKKQILEAEVRFLRRRRKFLLKTKSSTSQLVKSQNVETTQYRKSKKEMVNPKKAATLPSLFPVPNLNQRGKDFAKKKNIIPIRPSLVFDLDQNVSSYGINLNQMVYGNNTSPMPEFNQKASGLSGEKTLAQTRAPIFDLNQISMEEEEEVQEIVEDQRKDLHNDLKLALCRNVGDGSTNRSGKRKISWQDPVALSV